MGQSLEAVVPLRTLKVVVEVEERCAGGRNVPPSMFSTAVPLRTLNIGVEVEERGTGCHSIGRMMMFVVDTVY